MILRLAAYLEDEPARKKAAAEAQKAKLEALERKLGISGGSNDGGPSSSNSGEPEVLAGKKHRFDDTEYLETSREIVDGVKSAVSNGKFSLLCLISNRIQLTFTWRRAGLLKRKKKAKTTTGSLSSLPPSASKATTGKIAESAVSEAAMASVGA